MNVSMPGRGVSGQGGRRLFSFLAGHEFLIPLFAFLAFLALTLPGLSWGAPAIWHPDEVALRAIKALHGDWGYYEANFNHPFLPQNAMYLVGRLVQFFGGTDSALLVSARLISVVLLGLSVALAYPIARRVGARLPAAALASLLLLVSSEMMHNGHFAHTDAYVVFFSTLTVLFLLHYQGIGSRAWLYGAFLAAGLALSSKYNSILLGIAPPLVYLLKDRADLPKRPLAFVEPLFIGVVLYILGFGIGTPRFLTWPAFFLKRAVPAFFYNGSYGYQPGAQRGFTGQFSLLEQALGPLLFMLALAAVTWAIYRSLLSLRSGTPAFSPRGLLLLCLFLLDLPLMASYNLAVRFTLPLLPLLAVLSALFIEALFAKAFIPLSIPARLLGLGLGVVILFSLARTVSLMLLFLNDARYAAGDFLKTLPSGSSLEETFYPPAIPPGRFSREHNYPLYFLNGPSDSVPTGKPYDFNAAEAGLVERGTDYLLVDSFTASRFDDPYTCSLMRSECDFFKELASGESAHFRLLAEFHYSLPRFMPQIAADFVNPGIRIYERKP